MTNETRMSDADFQAVAIAHLLGEMEAAAEAAFARELARRGAAGRAELRSLQAALGDVALAAAAVDPPAGLRNRVLASVEGAGQRRFIGPWAAAAVLAAVSLGLGIWAARVIEERDGLRVAVERLESRLASADSAHDSLIALRTDLEFLGAPEATVVGLVGTPAVPDASARVFVDPATGRALLFAYELPILSADQLYELWVIGSDGPRAAGVFRPDERGRARLDIEDLQVLEGVGTLAVTIEPAPGVDQPTGEVVLSGRI